MSFLLKKKNIQYIYITFLYKCTKLTIYNIDIIQSLII